MERRSRERAKAVAVWRAFACFAVSAVIPTWAGVNTWTSIGPDGGRVSDVEFHTTTQGTLYATAASGLYRSTDFGQTWTLMYERLNSAQPFDIEMDPGDPNSLYIGPNDGAVAKSVDGGAAFTSRGAGGALVRVRAARDGNIVYATHGPSVSRSLDGGRTWELRSTLGATWMLVHGFTVDPQNPNNVYASMYPAGFYRSTDGAATWEVINTPAALQLIHRIAVDPLNSQRIWVATTDGGILMSVDRGSSWTPRTPATSMFDVRVHPTSPDTIFATSHVDGRVWKSVDAGVNWTQLPVNTGGAGTITINQSRPEQVAVTGDAGVFVSVNSGVNWGARGTGIKGTDVYHIVQQPGSNRSYLSAGHDAGLHWITENGEGTERINDFGLTLLPATPPLPWSRYIAASSTTLYASIDDRHIARTQSQGSLWTAGGVVGANVFPPPRISVIAASLTEPNKVFAGTNAGLYISNNHGDQWMQSTSGISATFHVDTITVTPNPLLVYIGGEENIGGSWRNAVLRSLDGGLTWNMLYEAPARVSIIAPHPVDARILYVGTSSGLRKSVDDGATWAAPSHPMLSGTFYIDDVVFDPTNSNIMYISHGGGVIRSVDSGETWQTLPVDANAQFLATKIRIDPLQPSRIYAGSRGSGVRQITLQSDLSVAVRSVAVAAPSAVPTSFSVDVHNMGRLDVTEVRVTLAASSNASGVSATIGGVDCPVAQQTATCTIANLRAEALATITVQASAGDGGMQVTASVQAAQPDGNATNNSATRALPAPVATPPSSGGGGGGGGGGGAMSLLGLLLLAPLSLVRGTRRQGCRTA